MSPTDSPSSAGWQFSLLPDAAEGGGSFRKWARKPTPYVSRGFAADPERAAEEAAKRARRSLRQYCAANRLNRLGTLTYPGKGCRDPAQIRADLGEFFRSLRTSLGGDPFPYAWVPEWHKTGHGLHAHFAVGRYVRRNLIASAWGRGFVHIKALTDLPSGSTSIGEGLRAAGYLANYVAKDFADPERRVLGNHRYDVAQGFKPQKVHLTGPTAADVIAQASVVIRSGCGPRSSRRTGRVRRRSGRSGAGERYGGR